MLGIHSINVCTMLSLNVPLPWVPIELTIDACVLRVKIRVQPFEDTISCSLAHYAVNKVW